MKVTKNKLKQIIREEYEALVSEWGARQVYAPSSVKPKFGSSSTWECTRWCRDNSSDVSACYDDCEDSLRSAARKDRGLGTSDRYMDMDRFEENKITLTKNELNKIVQEELKDLLNTQNISEEQLDEYYGAGYEYDCAKEADANGLKGWRRTEYIRNCDQRKREDSDRRAEKSMRQAAWREE